MRREYAARTHPRHHLEDMTLGFGWLVNNRHRLDDRGDDAEEGIPEVKARRLGRAGPFEVDHERSAVLNERATNRQRAVRGCSGQVREQVRLGFLGYPAVLA